MSESSETKSAVATGLAVVLLAIGVVLAVAIALFVLHLAGAVLFSPLGLILLIIGVVLWLRPDLRRAVKNVFNEFLVKAKG